MKIRLQSFDWQHHTTDDSTNSDYDYSEENSEEPTHFNLPLIPIINDNDTSIYTLQEPEQLSSTTRYDIELNEYSFREPNRTEADADSSTAAAPVPSDDRDEQLIDFERNTNSTVAEENREQDKSDSGLQEQNLAGDNGTALHPSETRVDGNKTNLDQNDAAGAENLTTIEQIESTSPEATLIDLHDSANLDDQLNEDDNYTTTSSELVINKSENFDEQSQAEKTISNNSDTIAIQLDDYFDTFLLNDSLLIDESSSDGNLTDIDYDVTTINSFSQASSEVEQSGGGEHEQEEDEETLSLIPTNQQNKTDVDETITVPTVTTQRIVDSTPTNNNFPYENRIIKDDQQNTELENAEASNKFIYHHLSATESLSNENANVLATPSTVVRFPTNNDGEEKENQRVRFPDEPSLAKNPPAHSFSWPRDNGYQPVGLMRFWQEQPLINDYKFVSRGNSRAPSGNFNRQVQVSYRRNFR